MSARSGEMARRAALGIGGSRNGAQVAQALQTIRHSARDRRRPDPVAQRAVLLTKRRDKGHLLWALMHEAARLKGDRQEIVARLEKLGPNDAVKVSDHAVVRFLERAMGIDINSVRAEIARLVPVDKLETDRVIYIRGGLQFLMSENNIVTILDGHMESSVAEAFSIDESPIAPLKRVDPGECATSSAARMLSRRAHDKARVRIDAMTARLRAELGAVQ